jgi:CO/xanthine dehydrogenase Mo-binding subunit
VACVRWLGRPADVLEMAVTEWPDLPVETSGDPHAMSQDEQDRLSLNPRWTPAFASASSASNSAYYFTHTTQAAARVVFLYGLWPAAVAIWAHGGPGVLQAAKPEAARWRDGALVVEGFEPLPLARLAQEAHARGLVVGAAVHGFNRWQWTEADFDVVGGAVRLAVDGLSLRYGDGAAAAKQALASTPNRYHVLNRRTAAFPPTRNNNAMVGYNTAVGTLAELSVDATNGKVAVLAHHTILECGNMLVPDLVSGQLQGGTATGIGLALHEELPLYEGGPGDGTWNFNRYHLPRGSDVAVWAQTAEILPPLSGSEPPKGMAEVVVIPIMAAIVNGIAHAIGHRFRTLPVTPDRILKVLG